MELPVILVTAEVSQNYAKILQCQYLFDVNIVVQLDHLQQQQQQQQNIVNHTVTELRAMV